MEKGLWGKRIRREVRGAIYKVNMRNPNMVVEENVLYLDCINVNILVTMLYYSVYKDVTEGDCSITRSTKLSLLDWIMQEKLPSFTNFL